MPHIKIDPMKELELLSQRMKRFVEDFPESFSFEIGKGFEPKIDIFTDNENAYVYIELPAVRKEDIKLVLKENVLSVSGIKNPDFAIDKVTAHRSERPFGEFNRRIALPVETDAGSISANLKEGVLAITISKLAKTEDKEISIEIQQ